MHLRVEFIRFNQNGRRAAKTNIVHAVPREKFQRNFFSFLFLASCNFLTFNSSSARRSRVMSSSTKTASTTKKIINFHLDQSEKFLSHFGVARGSMRLETKKVFRSLCGRSAVYLWSPVVGRCRSEMTGKLFRAVGSVFII